MVSAVSCQVNSEALQKKQVLAGTWFTDFSFDRFDFSASAL
jgi:hypothetical protein